MIYYVLVLPVEGILKMINISEEASQKIQQALIGRGKGLGIRVSIHTTGCSGLAYRLDFPVWSTRLVTVLLFLSFPFAVALGYLIAHCCLEEKAV